MKTISEQSFVHMVRHLKKVHLIYIIVIELKLDRKEHHENISAIHRAFCTGTHFYYTVFNCFFAPSGYGFKMWSMLNGFLSDSLLLYIVLLIKWKYIKISKKESEA